MKDEIEYLSKSEFAASQGWSPSYVTKLGDQGRLVLSGDGKLVNVVATLALLEEARKPGAVRHSERERCGQIVRYGIDNGCINQAVALAFETSMSAAQAIEALMALKAISPQG